MRYLGIDLGEKRTGLAAGDDRSGIISPIGAIVLPPGAALFDAIAKAAHEHDAAMLVIGLPLNMDGSNGPQAKRVISLGESLSQQLNIPIVFQDEWLTSAAADADMAQSGRTHQQKKKLRDALAATHILRDYIEAQ